MKRIGNAPYHICYECEDIVEIIKRMEERGCLLIKEPQEAVALDNKKVAFLYSENLGLFEIVEMG